MSCRGVRLFLAACISLSVYFSTDYASAGEPGPSLAEAARAAKKQFRPITKDDLAAAKAELIAATDRLNERLGEDAKNGQGWKNFVQLDKLQEQLRLPAGPNVAVLKTIYSKFLSGHVGLELVGFVDVREALRRYIWTAGAIDNPSLKATYEQVLDRLAADLEASGLQPSTEQAFRINEALRGLQTAGQAPELVEAMCKRLVHPNLYLQVSGEMVGIGIAGPVDEVAPVCDCILGTDIQGTGRTIGNTTVSLFPDADEAVFDIILLAVNNSENIGYHGPVCIYNTGRTGIGVCKRVWMDADGLSAHPAAANAETHTTITDIRADNGSELIERLAWKCAEKQQEEAEDIASEHARGMAAERVDRQADEMLCKANHDYLKKFRQPLVQRLVFPQVLRFSTTKDTFSVVAQTAAADQLAAPGEPPALAEKNPDLSVRVHQSMINNAAATVLSGMVLHEEMLQTMFSDLLGYVPERLKPDEDREPWTIEFARERPIAVSFADNGFTLTLRGRHFFKGDKPVLGMNVTASYKFVKADGVFKAIRQGKLEIVSASGKQLSARGDDQHVAAAAAGQGAATGDGGQGLHAQGQVGRHRTARAGRNRSAGRLAGDRLASRPRGKDRHRPVADHPHSFLLRARRTRPRRPCALLARTMNHSGWSSSKCASFLTSSMSSARDFTPSFRIIRARRSSIVRTLKFNSVAIKRLVLPLTIMASTCFSARVSTDSCRCTSARC